MSNPEVESVVQEAMDAFWAVVAKRYPEAKSGDLSPGRVFSFEAEATSAVEEWKLSNVK
ncbi:hypothetical protein [Pseudomonas sp. UBA7530]|uniref:hypothetical protein n=1 Tax=Pseudomonas sp. UBA7530 TaxID=1947341 RepID=UPI0025F34E93|nr:hypothetical protein [Pseudomonas sp. UBA7530]